MVFSSVDEVIAMEGRLRSFIAEAIEVEKAGLKKAFGALTPGRQMACILHFSGAKQTKTRRSRIEKCVRRILDGTGLND